MYVFPFVILGIFSISSALEKGSICRSPNGENASCIPIDLCQPIKRALLYLNPEAVQFAQESQCGYDDYEDTYLVCCGSVGKYHTIATTTTIFSTTPTTKTTPIHSTNISHKRRFNSKPQTTPATSQPTQSTIRRATFPVTAKEASTEANPLPPVTQHPLQDRTTCGIHAPDVKIVDGRDTQIREFPWLVSLKYSAFGQERGLRCTGTLISSRYVLTAADCLEIPGFNLIGVRLGKWNYSTEYDCYNHNKNILVCGHNLDIAVEEEIRHPNYYQGGYDNNIALLRLQEEVEFNDFIRPICLPVKDLDPAKPGSCMQTSLWNMGVQGTHSGVKLKGDICILPNGYCEQLDPHFNLTHPHGGCVESNNPRNLCIDNSGSPLMNLYRLRNESKSHRWYQEGILYKGLGCHRTGPTVYTRITKHLDWIESSIY